MPPKQETAMLRGSDRRGASLLQILIRRAGFPTRHSPQPVVAGVRPSSKKQGVAYSQ